MTNKRRSFKKGIILDPDTTALTEEGGVKYDDTAKKIQYKDDVGTKSVVSEDGTQTLENKTIDGTSATGNNTVTADADNISYDNGTSGLTATNVKAAIDEVQSNIEGKDEASEISYDNSTSGLAAANVQDAVDEVDGDLDTHIADTSTHGVTGDIVGTSDSQTITNKTFDADNNTISNIDNADIKALAGIDATKIADGSVTDTEFQYIGGLTSDAQTQLNNKLSGIGASNDNRVIRNDGTSGNSFQESGVTIDDSDVVSGVTQLNVDNIRVDGNTISSTDTNGNVELSPDGTGIVKANSDHQITGNVIRDMSTDSATGSNVTLTAPSTKNIRLTNGSLASIDMIPAGTDGQEIVLINATGGQITINDSTGATAANQIKTGTQAAIQLSDEASIPLVYDGTEAKWMVSAGVGGGDSLSDKSIYAVYDAEDQDVTGFTNISITTSSPINETASYSVDSYTASLPSITLNSRSKDRENNVTIQYTMTSGTAKFVVKDNSSNTLVEKEVSASSDVQTVNLPYFVKTSVTSIQLSFEDVSSATGLKIDDITFMDKPFVYKNLEEYDSGKWHDLQGFGSANTAIPYFNTELENNTGNIVLVENSSVNGFSITALKECTITASFSRYGAGTTQTGFTLNSSELSTVLTGITNDTDVIAFSRNAINEGASVSVAIKMQAGDVLRPHTGSQADALSGLRGNITFVAKAMSEHVITPAKSNINMYSARIQNNGSASITSKSSDWIDSVTRVNTGEVTVTFKSGIFSVIPAIVAIEEGSASAETVISAISLSSVTIQTRANDGSEARADLDFSIIAQKQEADITNTTFLAAVPVEQIMEIYEDKSSNTATTSITTGSWQTLPFNTLDEDIFGTLSTNQITLPPGKYHWFGDINIRTGGTIGARLRKVSGTATTLCEKESNANSTNGANTLIINKSFTITESTTYEIQVYCSNSNVIGGDADLGENNILNRQVIRKIK